MINSTPMLYTFGSLVIFMIGGLTGVMIALVPFDFQAHDSFFIVAHLHSVLIGGAVFPILAGLYYYFPIATGKLLSDRIGRVAFWLAFIGFNLTFMPMHVSGLRGMPRRVFTYSAESGLGWLNALSTIGAFILATGMMIVLWDILRTRRREGFAAQNPWKAGTLEWLQEMPMKTWGIRSIPEIDSRYPLWEQPNLIQDVNEGRFYLPDAEELKRETLVTSVIDAVPQQCLRLPKSSFVPMLAALAIGGFFVFGTFHWWWMALASLFLGTAVIVYWLWTGTGIAPEKEEKDIGLGLSLPLYLKGSDSIAWWAMLITMLADLTAFISLLFGYFFFWTIHSNFPPKPVPGPGVFWPSIALGLIVGAWGMTALARRMNQSERHAGCCLSLLAGWILGAAGCLALFAGPWLSGLQPTRHSYPAIVWLLVIWAMAHVAVGMLMQGYCIARRVAGRMSGRYDVDMVNTELYWHFTGFSTVLTVAVIAGFPLLV
jgi:cytochrome c oxidase subunit I+III